MSNQVLHIVNGRVVNQASPADFFTDRQVSGKFKFTGEIVAIEKSDVVFIVTVIIGNNLVKVIADESEVDQFAIGDKVLVASKAFNPLIQKI